MLESILQWMIGVHMQSSEPEEALKIAKRGEAVVKKSRSSTDREKAQMKILSAQAKIELLWRAGAENGQDGATDSRRLRREFDGALRTSELAVRLARAARDSHMLANALHLLGLTYWSGSRSADSLRTFEDVDALLQGVEDSVLQFRNLVLLAEGRATLGDHRAAESARQRAFEVARLSGDEVLLSQVEALSRELAQAAAAPQPQLAALAAAVAVVVPSVASSLPPTAVVTVEEAFTPPRLDEEAVQRAVMGFVRDSTGDDAELTQEMPLMDAGLDSLASVELRTRLQEEFGLRLGSAVIFNFPSVAALSRHIVEEGSVKGITWRGA